MVPTCGFLKSWNLILCRQISIMFGAMLLWKWLAIDTLGYFLRSDNLFISCRHRILTSSQHQCVPYTFPYLTEYLDDLYKSMIFKISKKLRLFVPTFSSKIDSTSLFLVVDQSIFLWLYRSTVLNLYLKSRTQKIYEWTSL